MALNGQFFQMKKGVTAAQLAAIADFELIGAPDRIIADISSLTDCRSGSFCYIGKLDADASVPKTGAVIITNGAIAAQIIEQMDAIAGTQQSGDISWLIADNPRAGFAVATAWLTADEAQPNRPASIAPSSTIAESASIGSNASIGDGSTIGAGAVIDDNVVIGRHCNIGANVVITCSILDDNITIQAGSVIGEAGFGFEMTTSGPVIVPHLGIVRIGQGTNIGANCTIDRGSLDDTVLGAHVMIDNLVHIAHNCVIGDRAIIAAQVGIAGSTIIGSSVVMGGQVGVADHLNIGDGAVLMARSGVTKDIAAGAKIAGFPGEDAGKYWRDQAKLRSLLRPKK